jgi:hypothetical protein
MEREKSAREQITESEYKAELLKRRQQYLLLGQTQTIPLDEAEQQALFIDAQLECVNSILDENVRVKFFKEGDSYFYTIEPKGRMGFKGGEK